MIGGVSKILIRKSWLMEQQQQQQPEELQQPAEEEELQHGGVGVGEEEQQQDQDLDEDYDTENDEERQQRRETAGEVGGRYVPPPPLPRKYQLQQHQEEETGDEVVDRSSSNTPSSPLARRRRDLSSLSSSSSSSSQQELLRASTTTDAATNTTSSAGVHVRSAAAVEGRRGSRRIITTTSDRRKSWACGCWNSNNNNMISMSKLVRYCGMVGMSILNPICCVLAMNYASPSILAPFSGLTLVWVILLSPLVVQETPSCQSQLACALIIIGEVIVAIFGDHTNDDGVSVHDVLQSYKRPSFLTYFGILILYESLLFYIILFCPKSTSSTTSKKLQRYAWGSAGGTITGMQNFLKDSLTILKASRRQQQDEIDSSLTRLLTTTTTSTSSSVGPTIKTNIHWSFFVFIALAGATAFAGLLVLTSCMKRYDATYSAASFVGSFVLSASIMSVVHYNTFQELKSIINYVLYPAGVFILMIGVYVLVQDTSYSDGDSNNILEEDDDDGLMTFFPTENNEEDDDDENGTDDGRRRRADTREENEVRNILLCVDVDDPFHGSVVVPLDVICVCL